MGDRPMKLEEPDRAKFELYEERARRLQAELNALNLAKDRLDREVAAFNQAQAAFTTFLQTTYEITLSDRIDPVTGNIHRKE